MDSLTKEEILHELSKDKENLEKLFCREIRGFAVPFDYYSELIEQCVKECGFEYARISKESYSFKPQKEFYRWKATVFHCDDKLKDYAKSFIENNDELALFQIVGHTYDFDVENKWNFIENILEEISKQKDILPMTNIEIIDYLKAMNKVEITNEYVKNNSDISLWFDINNTVCEIKFNEKVKLENKRK